MQRIDAAQTRDLAEPGSGTFGTNLAAIFHLKESEQAVTPWLGENLFAITRLRSDRGFPDRSTRAPSEPALHVSVSIQPMPLGSYDLWIDGKAIDVPHIPALHTSVIDLESDPIAWAGTGFDYVHYHIPKAGLDELAREHGIDPVMTYRFAICEHDLVIAQLTSSVLHLIGTREWTSSLALDQFSLVLGAHVLSRYAGIARLQKIARGGLAPWQSRRATEMIRENLDGAIHLDALARACELSASRFSHAFKVSFGVSPYRWLIERRVEYAQSLLRSGKLPIADIAMRSGFGDQAALTRSFRRVVGESPARWRRSIGQG